MPFHRSLVSALITSLLGLVLVGVASPNAQAAQRKPAFSKVKPSVGPTKKPSRVVIKGKRLNGTVRVTFGGKPGKKIRVISPRKITVVPPAHKAGKVKVRIKTRRGGWSVAKKAYRYVDPGTITRGSLDMSTMLFPSISGGGRYISYVQYSEHDGQDQIKVWDRATGDRRLVVMAEGPVFAQQISADGRSLVYTMFSELDPQPQQQDVYYRDLVTDVTTRVTQGDHASEHPWVSSDGRYVTFYSSASDLVPGDTNNKQDVFVWDRDAAIDAQMDRVTDGADHSFATTSVSDDGRFVAYHQLVAPGHNEVFVVDRNTEIAKQVTDNNSGSQNPVMSANGRYVAFESQSSTLVPGDKNGAVDVFVWARTADVIKRVARFKYGGGSPTISADGRFVAFTSSASERGSPDATNPPDEVYRWNRETGKTFRVTDGNGYSYDPELSANGRHIVFWSESTDLVPRDNNNEADVFVWDAPRA